MITIGLIIVGVWIIIKILGSGAPSNNRKPKSGLTTFEEYETFNKIRKK